MYLVSRARNDLNSKPGVDLELFHFGWCLLIEQMHIYHPYPEGVLGTMEPPHEVPFPQEASMQVEGRNVFLVRRC